MDLIEVLNKYIITEISEKEYKKMKEIVISDKLSISDLCGVFERILLDTIADNPISI